MAKVGYGPKDLDPSDCQAAAGRLCSFLETLERLASDEHFPLNLELVKSMLAQLPAAAEAASMVAKFPPPNFPVDLFASKILHELERMRRAREAIDAPADRPKSLDTFGREEAERVFFRAWPALVAAYLEFRGPLKLLALGSKCYAEAATGQTCSDETGALKGFSESEKRVAEEMLMALDFLRQQSETEEHEFEMPTYEVMYRALEELLADKGEKPSQTAETWRRYASKARQHLGIPGRKRRA